MSSENPYALLGNTSDQDSDREPSPPPKTVDKPLPRSGKRDAEKTAPSEPAQKAGGFGRGSGRGFTGSEGAFRGRDAGTFNNRGKVTDDGLRQDRHPDRIGVGRRGGRGDGGRGKLDDRHSRGLPHDHPKQGDLAWGAPTGAAEWNDEQAGQNMAVEEATWDASDAAGAPGWDEGAAQGAPGFTDSGAAPPADGGFSSGAAGAEAAESGEPEDTSISYADYLAKQAEAEKKRLEEGLGVKKAREPNEGAKDVGWQNLKLKSHEDDGDERYLGAAEKSKKKKSHQPKEPHQSKVLKVDLSWKVSAPEPRGGRGGRGEFRGRGRGGGGRGGGRGGRGGGDGEYHGRGGREGGRGGGDGEYHGRGGGREGGRGRGGNDPQPVAVDDESAFPSLGA